MTLSRRCCPSGCWHQDLATGNTLHLGLAHVQVRRWQALKHGILSCPNMQQPIMPPLPKKVKLDAAPLASPVAVAVASTVGAAAVITPQPAATSGEAALPVQPVAVADSGSSSAASSSPPPAQRPPLSDEQPIASAAGHHSGSSPPSDAPTTAPPPSADHNAAPAVGGGARAAFVVQQQQRPSTCNLSMLPPSKSPTAAQLITVYMHLLRSCLHDQMLIRRYDWQASLLLHTLHNLGHPLASTCWLRITMASQA